MKLKKIHNTKKKGGGNKTEKKTESVLSALTAGLCFDFHPTVRLWHGLVVCSQSDFVCDCLYWSHHSFLPRFIAPAGLQSLRGWYRWRSRPQVLLFKHSAVFGNLQKTFCKSFKIKASTVFWYGWFKDLSSLLIISHVPSFLHVLSHYVFSYYCVTAFSTDVILLLCYICLAGSPVGFTFMNRPRYWLLSQFIREDTGREETWGSEVN